MNFNNPKTKKTFAAVVAVILVASMVVSLFLRSEERRGGKECS